LLDKYKLNPDRLCAVYYRGTDKISETGIASYDTFLDKIKEIMLLESNESNESNESKELYRDDNFSILVNSDEKQFIDYIKLNVRTVRTVRTVRNIRTVISFDENKSIDNSTCEKGIHLISDIETNYDMMQNLLPIFHIMASCKYLICSSGNCAVWMVYYRGHANRVYQYLVNKFGNDTLQGWFSKSSN
jgi:hypothetical protein